MPRLRQETINYGFLFLPHFFYNISPPGLPSDVITVERALILFNVSNSDSDDVSASPAKKKKSSDLKLIQTKNKECAVKLPQPS